MLARGFSVSGVAAVLALSGLTFVGTANASESEPGAAPVVIDLPQIVRAFPRRTQIIADLPDGSLLLQREGPIAPDHSQGELEPVLHRPDGTETPLAGTVAAAAGAHVLFWPAESGAPYRTQELPTGDVEDLFALGSGEGFLGATEEGVLQSTGGVGQQSLRLIPWTGGEGTPLSPVGGPFNDARAEAIAPHGVVLSGTTHVASGEIFLDTATGKSWPIPSEAAVSGSLAIGDARMAWIDSAGHSLRTTTLPSDSSPTPPDPVTIPLPADFVASGSYDLQVLVVGDRIIVSHEDVADAPILSFTPDGASTTLLADARDVHRSGAGGIVAVGGNDLDRPGVVRVSLETGDVSTVLAREPMPGMLYGIAVDGDRVVTVDNSAASNALKERTVSFADGGVGTETTLGTDVAAGNCNGGPVPQCTGVVAGGGSTLWADKSKVNGWHLIDSEGNRSDGTSWPLYPQRLDGNLVQLTNRRIFDLTQDTISSDTLGGLENGVGFSSGGEFGNNSPENAIVERQLATGLTTAVLVPGCVGVIVRDVVGSWANLGCYRSAASSQPDAVAFNLADPTAAPIALGAGETVLGNGFALRRDSAQNLWWTPLTSAGPLWQRIGTAGAWGYAASTGARPTAAWASPDGRGHVALLPVQTNQAPSDLAWTGGPTLPVSQTAWAGGAGSALHVTWADPPVSEHVFEYAVSVDGASSTTLAGSARSYSFTGLDASRSHTVTVTARNFSGRTSATSSIDAVHTDPVDTTPPPGEGAADHVRPTVSLANVGVVQTATTLTLAVAAADDRPGVSASLRMRERPYGTAPLAWHVTRTGLRSGRVAISGLNRGSTYCVSAQATDAGGNQSAWSPARCVTVAMDHSILRRSGRWKVVRARAYLGGTSVRALSRKSQVSLGRSASGSVWLLATTCPTCGTVAVTGTDGKLRRVSLRSRTVRPSAWVQIPGGPVKGPWTLRVTSRRGQVTLDGVAIVPS